VAAGGDCYVLSPACRESANDSKCGTLAASASALAAAVTSAFFFVTRTDTDKDLKGTLHQSCTGLVQEGCSNEGALQW
jgi:hypothetical protein